jgi:hypothetical protein
LAASCWNAAAQEAAAGTSCVGKAQPHSNSWRGMQRPANLGLPLTLVAACHAECKRDRAAACGFTAAAVACRACSSSTSALWRQVVTWCQQTPGGTGSPKAHTHTQHQQQHARPCRPPGVTPTNRPANVSSTGVTSCRARGGCCPVRRLLSRKLYCGKVLGVCAGVPHARRDGCEVRERVTRAAGRQRHAPCRIQCEVHLSWYRIAWPPM